jgi:hypothetical protein
MLIQVSLSHRIARRTHDCAQVPVLLEQIADPVASVSADGAYDTKAVYEAAHSHGEGRTVRVLIPPGRDAQLSQRPSAAVRMTFLPTFPPCKHIPTLNCTVSEGSRQPETRRCGKTGD